MNTKIIATLITTLMLSNLYAEAFRTWTEAETKRTIIAKIKDKKIDDSEAHVLTKDGKSIWLKSVELIKKDQEYIKKWVKPVDHLSVRVVGFKKGSKKLEVIAVAGSQAMKVRGRRPGKKKPIERKLAAGETLKFEYWAPREYWVRAFYGKKMIEEETDKSKTGL